MKQFNGLPYGDFDRLEHVVYAVDDCPDMKVKGFTLLSVIVSHMSPVNVPMYNNVPIAYITVEGTKHMLVEDKVVYFERVDYFDSALNRYDSDYICYDVVLDEEQMMYLYPQTRYLYEILHAQQEQKEVLSIPYVDVDRD